MTALIVKDKGSMKLTSHSYDLLKPFIYPKNFTIIVTVIDTLLDSAYKQGILDILIDETTKKL